MKSFNTFILEKLYIPHTNLGIDRANMPQIASDKVPEFIRFLKTEYGIPTKRIEYPIRDLKLTQKDINHEKILGMYRSAPEAALKKPVIVSKDGYVLDGHHRLVALVNRDMNAKIDSYLVNTDINNLLAHAREFPETFYKSINEDMANFRYSIHRAIQNYLEVSENKAKDIEGTLSLQDQRKFINLVDAATTEERKKVVARAFFQKRGLKVESFLFLKTASAFRGTKTINN